jgi:hypothetical protein
VKLKSLLVVSIQQLWRFFSFHSVFFHLVWWYINSVAPEMWQKLRTQIFVLPAENFGHLVAYLSIRNRADKVSGGIVVASHCIMKVMVWYFVTDAHELMTTLFFIVLVLVWWNRNNSYIQNVIVEYSLQSYRYEFSDSGAFTTHRHYGLKWS